MSSSDMPVVDVESKIVIAHRGASGYLPEHTLAAKAMAYAQGADYLEQDLVLSQDNQLVVLHDHFLDRVTDVAQQFPDRARSDGRYYVIDFTLAQMRQLNVTERFELHDGQAMQVYPKRFPMGKSRFQIHTFEEEIELIQGLNHATGKQVGIYPEIKSPWFHRKEGRDITRQALAVLKKYGYVHRQDRVYVQCFDPNELQRIRFVLFPEMKMDLKLVQLIAYTDWEETYVQAADGQWRNYDYDWMFQAGAMPKIAHYADVIGPQCAMLMQSDSNFHLMLSQAKQAGLAIHPFTVRADALPDAVSDLHAFFAWLYFKADVQGLFTDFPDLAVQFLKSSQSS